MISEDKMSKFVAELINATKTASINWETMKNPKNKVVVEGEQQLVGKVYYVEYKDKMLQLFRYNDEVQVDEYIYNKTIFYKLVIVDDNWIDLWEFPRYLRELKDLYDIVRYKTAELDKYFDLDKQNNHDNASEL